MLPLPPPSTLPVVDGAIAAQIVSDQQEKQEHKHNDFSPSIMIVTGIIAFVFITSALIHFLIRYLSHRRHHRQNRNERSHSVTSPASLSSTVNLPQQKDRDQKALIEFLPLFTLASSVVPLPKSTPDCAVCLSKFEPQEQLRLLPACRHAFHSSCIDTWLQSTPSCPLCRSSVVVPVPSPNPITNFNLSNSRSERSASFRLEIGSISRRREETVPSTEGGATLVRGGGRSYSLGSSFEYVVEEEIDAVVAAVAAHVRSSSKDNEAASLASGPTAGEEMLAAEVAAGGNGSGRWWLKDYVDRLSSSASSSFSSRRFSGRWTRQSDTATTAAVGGEIAGVECWDLEEGNISSGRMGEDLAVYLSLYTWLVGV